MLRFFHFAVLPAATLLATVPAIAEQAPTRQVSFADLDLATSKGQATFHRRVAAAIDDVCGRPDPMSLAKSAPALKCRRAAADGVQVEVASVIERAKQQASIQAPRVTVAAR